MSKGNGKRSRWRWGVEVLAVIAVLLAIQAWQTRGAVSGPAPPLPPAGINAETPAADQQQGPRLVHFWAEWCPVCRFEEDQINALARDHAVMTVALASGDDGAVRRYLQEHQLEFPVVNDETGALAERWGVEGVPTSFVIDEDGQVRFVTRGYTTSWGLRARLWWAGL
ncbi:MAG: protein disulfide oxidoreductase [Pseudomonadota bacterium]